MFGRLFGFWAAEIFSSNCFNCLSASSWFRMWARINSSSRPMVVTKYRRPPRICVPFQIPDDLRRRIFRRYLRSTYGGDPASDDDFIPVAVKLPDFAPP